MEGCSKTSAGAASGLPDDPLVDILSRVPAKSVCRFKCVSKAWRDLIDDPDNRKKLRQPMQGLFFDTSKVSEDDGEVHRVSFSFIDLRVRSVPLDDIPSFSFLTEMTGMKTFFFSDSCNGLILFTHYHYQETSHLPAGSYIVCNPTTKQWLAVPACGSCNCKALSHTYLAFDPAVSSHFHLVQLQTVDMLFVGMEIVSLHVYSSETGTWSQNTIDKQKEQGQLEGRHHQLFLDYHCAAFVNGFLHLIVWRHILVLDVQGKTRRLITLPGMADGCQRDSITFHLGQSQGHLHCVTREFANEHNDKLCTWVLQDYDTQEWLLKSTVHTLDVFGETRVRPKYQVLDIHQDRNVVFFFNDLTHELIAYDMDRKEVRVIATFEDKKFQSEFARYIPYFAESPTLTNKH